MFGRERVAVSEIIRPAAIVPEDIARSILVDLSVRDVASGGLWRARPNSWSRWNKPWSGHGEPPEGVRLIGNVEVAYGTPSRYEVTIYRVVLSDYGLEQGWSVRSLVDEALSFGGVTLDDCPRADLPPPPPPVRI